MSKQSSARSDTKSLREELLQEVKPQMSQRMARAILSQVRTEMASHADPLVKQVHRLLMGHAGRMKALLREAGIAPSTMRYWRKGANVKLNTLEKLYNSMGYELVLVKKEKSNANRDKAMR